MKKLLILVLLLFSISCMAKVEINPCDDIETIKNNPTILGNCYPNYITAAGEGLSPRELLAIDKAKVNAQRNLAFLMANDTLKYEEIGDLPSEGFYGVELISKSVVTQDDGKFKAFVIVGLRKTNSLR